MKKTEKLMRKIRIAEAKLVYATPSQSARLAEQIAYWKAVVFDGD